MTRSELRAFLFDAAMMIFNVALIVAIAAAFKYGFAA